MRVLLWNLASIGRHSVLGDLVRIGAYTFDKMVFAMLSLKWWHGVLDLPNANRDYFGNNRSYQNIRSEAQRQGRGSVVGLGDFDLLALWSFWNNSKLYLAANFAFKVPTGRSEIRLGSGYPDIGAALLLDWHPWNRWGFYLNTGILIPLAGEERSMVQAVPAVEFRIIPDISIPIQLKIQSAPFKTTPNQPQNRIEGTYRPSWLAGLHRGRYSHMGGG